MSQNPNGPNFNPNPYGPGPNPVNPNYPATPGTAYGSSQPYPQPPSGPNPNPNIPSSSYGAYGNPNSYAPPPPPQTPYPNPPTPLPPTTGPNLYDPYAPTAMSQQPISSAYPSYPGYPPVGPSQPPTQPPSMPQSPQKKSQLGLTIALIIAAILVIGGSIFGVVAYNSSQNTMHATATATAQSQSTAATNARLTVTAQTATAIASVYPFSNNLVLNDPLVDNTKGENWDTNAKFCTFSGSAYHVSDDESFTYNPCFAVNTNFSNFTFQAEMVIKQGTNNPAAGLVFRANKTSSKFYRFVVNIQGDCSILLSVDTTGTNTRNLKNCQAPQFNLGLGVTNTLGVVAKGDQISVYVNQQLITSLSDSTFTSGQIGLIVQNPQNSLLAEAVFSNVEVWQLP